MSKSKGIAAEADRLNEVLSARDILGNLGVTTAGRAAVTALGFVMKIVLARFLGPGDLGLYGLLLYTLGLTVVIANMGTQSAHVHDLGRGRSTPGAVLGFSLLYASVIGTLAIVSFYLVYSYFLYDWYFAKYFQDKFPIVVLLIFLDLPVRLLILHLQSALLGLRKFKFYNVILLAKPLSFLLLFSLLASQVGYTLAAAIIAWIAADVVTVSLLFAYYRSSIASPIRVDLSEVRHILSYGGKAMISGLTHTLTVRLDLFIVGYFLGAEEVGLYFLASTLAVMVGQSSVILSTVLFPYNSAIDPKQAISLTNTTFRVFLTTSLLALPVAIPIALYGIPLIFGASYGPSAPLFLVLLFGAISISLIRILYSFLLSQGRHERGIIAYVTNLIALFFLDILLIPQIGALGAAIGFSMAYLVGLGMMMYQYRSFTRAKWTDVCLIKLSDLRRLKRALFRKNTA